MVKLSVVTTGAGLLAASTVSGFRLSGKQTFGFRKKGLKCKVARNIGQTDHWIGGDDSAALLQSSTATEQQGFSYSEDFLQEMSVPGAGKDLEKIKSEIYKTAYKDGFSYVNCLSEGMRKYADFHEDPNAYGAQNVNVSVVFYDTVVEPEDRKDMTHGLCFSFCRSIENMNFFGLLNSKECYCMPYYKPDVGGEDSICDSACEGNPAEMCGGKSKTGIFEMHMCADTETELSDSITSVSELSGMFQMEITNLGVCSSSMQYIGSSTQLYGQKAGDKFMGDYGQGYKVLSGKQEDVNRRSFTAYEVLQKKLKELEKAQTWDFSDAKKTDEADKLMTEAGSLITKYSPLLETLFATMKECSGQLGIGHEDRMGEYFPITRWVDNAVYKEHGDEVDSICDTNKDRDFLGMFIGDRRDCAYRCDMTIHPKKCVGFQHFDVLSSSQTIPSGVPLTKKDENGWDNIMRYGKIGVDSLRGGPEEWTIKNDKPSPTDAGKFRASDNYLTARVKAGYKIKLVMPEGFCDGKFSLRMYDSKRRRYELYTQKAWTSKTMPCGMIHFRNGETRQTEVLTIAEATKREFTIAAESDEVYAKLYFNAYGDHTSGSIKFDFRQVNEQEDLVGVCQLFAKPSMVSYYTPQKDDKCHKKSGKFSGCFMKFSESKGFKLDKKAVFQQKRCLLTDKIEVPELKEFSFNTMVNSFGKL